MKQTYVDVDLSVLVDVFRVCDPGESIRITKGFTSDTRIVGAMMHGDKLRLFMNEPVDAPTFQLLSRIPAYPE